MKNIYTSVNEKQFRRLQKKLEALNTTIYAYLKEKTLELINEDNAEIFAVHQIIAYTLLATSYVLFLV